MNYLKKYFILILCFFLLNTGANLYAQDSSSVDVESTIKVSAHISTNEVPLNRDLTFTVKVIWEGDLNKYHISDIENPVLDNFEIMSTATADRRMSESGVNKAAKIYEFILKPNSLGMGYVEEVIVKYIDNETGDGHHLITNRLNIKIIDPVPEPGSKKWLIKWIILCLFAIVVFIVFYLWKKKQKEIKRQKDVEEKIVLLEEEYLTNLKDSIDLTVLEINIKDTFWKLSKIFRKYLSQKYDIPALESTTDNIMELLVKFDLDMTMINNIREVLSVSDLAKFAGSEGSKTELDRCYTLVEVILEKNLNSEKTASE